jgi:hypothetical protein
MNGGFGPGLGVSFSTLRGDSYSYSSHRFTAIPKGPGVYRSHTSSHGSHYSERIQPHPSHYGHPRPPAPLSTIAPKKGKWMIPLCYKPEIDVGTCWLGWWCPQFLYGRTQRRLKQMAQKKDPQDLINYKVICSRPLYL